MVFKCSQQVFAHHLCSIDTFTFRNQVKHLQVLLAMLGVAFSVLHGTVRNQAADPIHTSDGVNKKWIA